MYNYFVNRETEINSILNYLRTKSNIFVYGLRGIGKTTLLEKIQEKLIQSEKKTLYIDSYDILSPEDILALISERPIMDSRYAIKTLFERDDYVIIIDEFSSLIQTLARYPPFRRQDDVIKYIRSQIQARRKRGGESIILSSSALGFVKRITMKYFAPLFREFKLLFIGPMSFEHIYELALKNNLDEKIAREIAEVAVGNPFYARKIIELIIAQKISPRDAVFNLIASRGDLDIYFSALMDAIPAESRYILHLIARGIKRFYEIENKLYKDPTPYLKRLEENGLLAKVKKGRKFSEYIISDKVFQAWLLSQEIPSLGKISRDTIYISSLGFEALVRELFSAVTTRIEIKDWLDQRLEIPPFKTVFNLNGSDYEIDAIGLKNDEAYIFEVHFWGKARFYKVKQLIKNTEKFVKEYNKRVKERILISYFGYKLSEEEIQQIKKRGIKLLTAKELREIQSKINVKLGF
ncbi:MAG: ATP-binding protein [Candidatus Njordarchaeum guaymaensis]